MSQSPDLAALRALHADVTKGDAWYANEDPSASLPLCDWAQITRSAPAVIVKCSAFDMDMSEQLVPVPDGAAPENDNALGYHYERLVCSQIACEGGGFQSSKELALAVAAVNALPALLDRVERAERDSARLDWMAENPPFDGFAGFYKDIYGHAGEVAAERGEEEANAEDYRAGFRRMIDAARRAG